MGLTSRQTMGFAALLMGGSVFLSRFMGLIRDKVISWQFGAGADTDVYFAAFVVPDFINYLLAGGYVSMTLIPLLSASFERDEEDGWRFFSCVICWNSIAAGVLVLLGWVFAPQLARLTMPGFDEAQLARLTLYLRIILPGQLFFLAGSCLTALLYIRKSFAVPALTPLIYNGCIIVGGVAWPFFTGTYFEADMTGYAVGASLGALFGAFALPLYAATRSESGGVRFRAMLRHPLLWRYVRLALPLMVGQSVVVLDEQLVRVFGSMVGEGVVSQLNYARRIMLVPVGVVAQAAGVASFPFLTALAASGDRAAFTETMSSAISKGLFVMLPIAAWMIAAAEPVLGLIFEGGRFGAEDTRASALLLQVLLLSLPFWLVQQIVGRCFYAWQDTVTPAVLGTLVTVLALPVYWVVTGRFGAMGVAVVSAGSIACYAVVLAARWVHCFGTAAFRGLASPLFRCALFSGLAGAASWAAERALRDVMPFDALNAFFEMFVFSLSGFLAGMMQHALCLAVSLAVFVAVYALLALLFLRRGLNIR